MQRHIYRFITLMLLFVGAIVMMTGRLEEVTFHTQSVTNMAEASFPTLYLLSLEQELNPLYGYGMNLDADVLRESLTPLGEDQTFYVIIEEHSSRVKRLLYEIWDGQVTNIVDSGSVSAMDEYEGNKSVKVHIRVDLEQEQEYFVKLTAVTATGKKIRYFTRVKYTPEDHFKENLDFIYQFHEILFEKDRAEEIRSYLESDETMDNHSLAYVNIHSSLDVVTWGLMDVAKETEPMPVVIENNTNTTSIQLKYMVSAQAEADAIREEYYVTEFYRVQWTQNAMYLLAYERNMEEVYHPAMTSLAKSELKLGIASEEEIVTSGENSRLCFVRERELWYYKIAENQAVRVFSFRSEGSLDRRELYDQHNIRILRMDDFGNIDFMVYGYMNRGVYEGRVAIVLYHFYAEENRIEELVYIPLETSYQILKEDLNRLSYVNENSVFYFSFYNTFYAYNIITKRVETVAEDITESTSLVFPGGSRVVWQNSSQGADCLIIMDLETGKRQEIIASKGKVLQILGGIDNNMIYGIGEKEDISQAADGSVLIPMNQVIIADNEGNICKKYEKDEVYIWNASVEENVVTLKRCRRTQTGEWIEIEDDHILNYVTQSTPMIGLSERVTERMLSEWYITLPYGYELDDVPSKEETVITIIHDETTLHLAVMEEPLERYYLCIYGQVSGMTMKACEAIAQANEKMGYVINEKNRIVWERGAKKRSAAVRNIDILLAEKVSDNAAISSDTIACIRMMLAHRYVEVDAHTLAATDGGMVDMLDAWLGGGAVNLSGTTLNEVLYYISCDCPVMALTKDSSQKERMVLITGYNEYVITWIDPVKGIQEDVMLSRAEETLKLAGNVFISYLP